MFIILICLIYQIARFVYEDLKCFLNELCCTLPP